MHTTNSAQTTENGGELCLVQLILEREWKNTCRNSVLIFKIFLCYSYATLCFPWYVAVFVASLAPMPWYHFGLYNQDPSRATRWLYIFIEHWLRGYYMFIHLYKVSDININVLLSITWILIPRIVQYLGSFHPPQNRLSVLLTTRFV